VEAPAAVEAPAVVEAPAAEKLIIFGLSQEPELLNPLIQTQTAAYDVGEFIIEGLLSVDPSGSFIPSLAKEVPTTANGQVSADGMQVTYHLIEGVLWSDGAPFTCDDVVFTWEVAVSPDSGAVNTTGYDKIASVECSDELTVVVTYSEFYAPFLTLFDAIMPRHATGELAAMQEWDYNRNPIGTGPFLIQEWVTGDQIILVKNPNYRDYPEKPYLDKIVVRLIASVEVGKALLTSGEIDFLWNLLEADVPEFENNPNVNVNATSGAGTERLVLNLGDPAIDATDDPINNPHPILGDLRVRQAIQYGIDKQFIVDELLYGATTVGVSELSLGWAKCDIAPSEYNPEKAMALLDEAGFTDQDGDGVRECHDCLYAEEGTPMRMKYQTTSGNQLREESQQLVAEMMAEIGVDLFIENVPSAELFGSWSSGAFRKHGQYDVIMYTTSDGVDPQSQMDGYFSSNKIPVEANGGNGFNYSRWINATADAAIVEAGANPDSAARKAAYQIACEQIDAELPHIYLYDRAEIHMSRTRLVGYEVNAWNSQGWNAAEWDVTD
nr:peptide ABC transporter substrate-binding protein [Caldilineaceae bacterium]